jgi:ABC-type Mn2+/Zn2+ transport system ATPase subunit
MTAAPGTLAGSAGSAARPDAIVAHGLAVGYRGEVVVDGIDVRVAPGTSLALVGTNGSGKSTLLKTLVGIQPLLRGDLRVLGRAPGDSPRGVGYLSQFHASGFVLPLRAIDVVRMARFPNQGLLGRATAEDRELVEWALERMGVIDLARSPLRSLSGGQRQRVYLAQVLARRADVLLLDEPDAGLDAAGREHYLDAFAGELRRGAAIVTATHDIGEAIEYAQVLLLARRVVALGPGREVLTPDRLMETFGIVIRDPHIEHAGRFTVAERSHGAPQVVDLSVVEADVQASPLGPGGAGAS